MLAIFLLLSITFAQSIAREATLTTIGTQTVFSGTYEEALQHTQDATISSAALNFVPALKNKDAKPCTLFIPTDTAWKSAWKEKEITDDAISSAAKILHSYIIPKVGLSRTQLSEKSVLKSVIQRFIVIKEIKNSDKTTTHVVRIKPFTPTAKIIRTIFCTDGVVMHMIDTILPTT